MEHAQIVQELVTAQLDLQRIVVDNVGKEATLAAYKERITRRHVAWVRSKLAYDQDDLARILADLEKRRTTLLTNIKSLRRDQQEVEKEWLQAQKQLEGAMGADETARSGAASLLAAREAWRETSQKVLEQTETMLLFLDQEKQFWRYRYSLLESVASQQDLHNWEEQVSGYLHTIEGQIEVSEQYHTDLQSEIASLRKQLNLEDLAPDRKKHVVAQVQALHKMAEQGFEYLSLLQGTRSIGKRLLDEINVRQNDAGLNKRVQDVVQGIKKVWEVELWVIDERSVTVHKLIFALLIFVAGMVFVRLFIRVVIRRILKSTLLDTSATVAIEKLLCLTVLVVLLIVALRLVNIPLTVFTFLGGGLALSAGFGARNLLNNFISGFILMAERPVKINDMIEVDNNFGIIENIGMRCTRVRTSGNIHILVPNSSFLEKNIVNWTLSDQEIRAKVIVRVPLDADPHAVEELILQAAGENSRVLYSPKPLVLLDEMLVGSLRFILYFWVSMKNLQLLERRIIESDVRFRIITRLKEAGIALAQQQRNVHLDTSRPVDLQLHGAK